MIGSACPPSWLALVLSSTCWLATSLSIHAADSEFPRKPIRVVVPFAAGGGSDTFVRLLTRAIRESDLCEQPLAVLNVPGAGGVIGSRRVRHAPADGYTVLNLHEAILTAKYAGNVRYGPEAFDAVAATGRVAMILAVPETGNFSDLDALVAGLVERPNEIRFAANLGAPSHFAGLLLEHATDGGAFRFVQMGGGAKRFAALVGGHAEVTIFSVAEYLTFREGGIRALALLSDERLAALPDVPTATERGLGVRFDNWQYWWVPKGTPRDRREALADLLQTAMETPEVQERLAEWHIEPTVLRGEALQRALVAKEESIAALAIRRPVDLPALGPVMLGSVLLLGGCWGFSQLRGKGRRADWSCPSFLGFRRVVLGGMLMGLYLLSLGQPWASFPWLTFGFVVTLGLLLKPGFSWRFAALVALGLILGFGGEAVFGHWLQIDLP